MSFPSVTTRPTWIPKDVRQHKLTAAYKMFIEQMSTIVYNIIKLNDAMAMESNYILKYFSTYIYLTHPKIKILIGS